MSPRRRRTGIAAHHIEWMRLLEIDGPFLSVAVLAEVFPDGLDPDDRDNVANARAAFDAWATEPTPDGLATFARSILEDLLDYRGLVAQPSDGLSASLPGRRIPLRPEWAVGEKSALPTFLVTLHSNTGDLDRAVVDDVGNASPIERLRILLNATDRPLGLTTNGRQWALVHAPRGLTTSVAIWETELWFDERLTFRAFESLLGARRTIGAAAEDTLLALFERSGQDEREVTDQLGYQVRRSIELLVHAFDRADDDAGGELFRLIEPKTLYEAAVSVAMRLVFLLAAEARGLLPDDEAWIEAYAVTPVRDQLEEAKVAGGEELLERRFDAWARLLATFRAVHGGVEHDRLRLPGYGGGLFDPGRFPFLESVEDRPLWIPNRTILNILESLQTLEVEVTGGRERRPLSYTALGVEQIGHTYERLLDHTAVRADAPAVGLVGKKGEEPEVSLTELEEAHRLGRTALVASIVELTGKQPTAIEKLLDTESDEVRIARLHATCRGDFDLIGRITPLLGVVRDDDFAMPMVFRAGGLYVTQSPGRRSTGTHYTPPSLTEPIVRHALEPVVYRGPAEGAPETEWELKTSAELLSLKVADIAMGSGAFLVAACRYLADRLVDAWELSSRERQSDVPGDPADLRRVAKRLVAERCLYGVDKDPLAVEIAKVSLWLETMRKDRPFTFVDHSLRSGDSLLGLTNLEQLEALTLDPETASSVLLEPARAAIRLTLENVREERERIESTDAVDVRELDAKVVALAVAERQLQGLHVIGNLIVGAALGEVAGTGNAAMRVETTGAEISEALGATKANLRDALLDRIDARASDALMAARAASAAEPPKPFHWVLEFPEVFERPPSGFDAIIGNPPFLGGKKISGTLTSPYRELVVRVVAGGVRGNADLVAYFVLRSAALLRSSGAFGLVATNSVGQGETRDVGLAQLCASGVSLIRAQKNAEWPGEAAVTVSHVWAYLGHWAGSRTLDGVPATGITPGLNAGGRTDRAPHSLRANSGLAHYGVLVNGEGFLLGDDEASDLLRDTKNAEVILPYVIAQDLTSRPDQRYSRWVIDFRNWPLETAERYAACMAIVRERVMPSRLQNKGSYKKYWWQFGRRQDTMRAAIADLPRVLIGPQTSKYWFVVWAPSGWIYSHATTVFAFSDDGSAAVLSSTMHELWARTYSGSLQTGLRYSPTDCFHNFPFPTDTSGLQAIGSRYLNHRKQTLVAEGEGLTKIYNRLHEQPEDLSERIEELRRLRCRLDQAVVDAFGWTGLELDHQFRETSLGLRYTISDGLKTEVLERLLELNHVRYAEELSQGSRDNSADRHVQSTSVADGQLKL